MQIRTSLGFIVLIAGLAGCAPKLEEHPWLELPEASAHEIVESAGVGGGQVVIAMDPAVTPEEALRLGEKILAQAPSGGTVNVRLYNDPATARNWKTVPADWTRQHLWVVVRANPESGLREVRWVGPDEAQDGG